MEEKSAEEYPRAYSEPTPVELALKTLIDVKHELEWKNRRLELLQVKSDALDTVQAVIRAFAGCRDTYCGKEDSGWRVQHAIETLQDFFNSEHGPTPNPDADIFEPVEETADCQGDVTAADTYREAMNEFCDLVEKGEIRPRSTYAKFCRILGRSAHFDHVAQEGVMKILDPHTPADYSPEDQPKG